MIDNFLNTAQWLKHPDIWPKREELITNFNVRFAGFGSCFAQNIQQIVQPFGFEYWYQRDVCAHYSAESMANVLEIVSTGRVMTDDDLIINAANDGAIISYPFYFKKRYFGAKGITHVLGRMRSLADQCRREIQECNVLVLTLGTARVLRLLRNGKVLNTAAHIGGEFWESEMSSVEDNVRHLNRVFQSVHDIRGGDMPTIILTISPQRYLFSNDIEGLDVNPFLDNMLSKSILRVAADNFCKEHTGCVRYFPSYEVVIDELRVMESLSHYDFTHIDQKHTPEHVAKKFLQSYCSDAMLEHFTLIEEVRDRKGEMLELLSGGCDAGNSQLTTIMDNLLSKLEAVDGEISPKIFGYFVDILEEIQNRFGDRSGLPEPWVPFDQRVASLSVSLQRQLGPDDRMKLFMGMKANQA